MAEENYADALDKDGRDWVALAKTRTLSRPEFRSSEVKRLETALLAKRSVLLVGPTGVGKTSVISGLAYALSERPSPRLVEISTVGLMSGTRYLGEWETKVTAIAKSAEKTKTILYVTDVVNLTQAGVTRNNTRSVLDALRPFMEAGSLVMVGECTPETLRTIHRIPAFSGLFETQVVPPLSPEETDQILARAAETMDLSIGKEERNLIDSLTKRFLPSRPPPGPGLKLLEQIDSYAEEKRRVGEFDPIDVPFIERVFSIYSGLPLFVVSKTATVRAQEIRQWFAERIVGQEAGIDAVVETISLFKAGLHDPQKPLGTLFFVGPTGVGKTEVARALATYLFGSPQRLLRFDLSEFKDYHSFEMLLGSASDPTRPATLVDSVRAQPFQVVLFDELEKAHPNVWDVMLSLLDEGRLTTPSGDTVDFRSTIIIATSNAGAEEAKKSLGFGAESDPEHSRTAKTTRALEAQFRPEFLNRFQHIVVFQPLSREQVKRVARQELTRILDREGISGRNLVVEVDDAALDLVIDAGYQSRFGARALKREIQRMIVLPLAVTLMEQRTEPGQVLRVVDREGRVAVRVVDTALTRETRRAKEPVKAKDGRKLSPKELQDALEDSGARLAGLRVDAQETQRRAELLRLQLVRSEPAFWQKPEEASAVLEEMERIGLVLERLDRLGAQQTSLLDEAAELKKLDRPRDRLADAVRRLEELEAALDSAWVELVAMGKDADRDAVVLIDPVGGARAKAARDLLVSTYRAWVESRRHSWVWLYEPTHDDEPAAMLVRGRYAYGYLELETGLHRTRQGEELAVARVTVLPQAEGPFAAEFVGHRALKLVGAYEGKIRSRLECSGGLVLQNERTLAQNRELAKEVWATIMKRPPPSDTVVRRYEPEVPLFVDALIDETSGRPDALSPARFQELLVRRARLFPRGER
ncbi:MAG: AAA family ATPase [Myxococcota bacterium]